MTRPAWGLLLTACVADAPVLSRGLTLPPARGFTRAELVFRCVPGDADVALDGVPQGTCEDFDGSPKGLGLGAGARRVEVTREGFQRWEARLVADGTRMTVDVNLLRNEGSTP